MRIGHEDRLGSVELTDDRATRVQLEDANGAKLADFALGKSSGQRGAFVRPRFDGVRDGAYAVSQDLRGDLGLSATRSGDTRPQAPRAAHFHDLALPPFAMEGSMRIEMMTPGWTVAFEKRGPAWIAAERNSRIATTSSGRRMNDAAM